MATVKIRCFYHSCKAESKPFTVATIILFLWKLQVAIWRGSFFYPKQFKRVSEYHLEQDEWLIECDMTPTKQGIIYGMCPYHSKDLLGDIHRT